MRFIAILPLLLLLLVALHRAERREPCGAKDHYCPARFHCLNGSCVPSARRCHCPEEGCVWPRACDCNGTCRQATPRGGCRQQEDCLARGHVAATNPTNACQQLRCVNHSCVVAPLNCTTGQCDRVAGCPRPQKATEHPLSGRHIVHDVRGDPLQHKAVKQSAVVKKEAPGTRRVTKQGPVVLQPPARSAKVVKPKPGAKTTAAPRRTVPRTLALARKGTRLVARSLESGEGEVARKQTASRFGTNDFVPTPVDQSASIAMIVVWACVAAVLIAVPGWIMYRRWYSVRET
jgi:hypothetical protein